MIKEKTDMENVNQTQFFCPQCGSHLESKAKFCPQCGKEIVIQNIYEENNFTKETNNNQGNILLQEKIPGILSIPVILLIGLFTCGLAIPIMGIIRLTKYPGIKKFGSILVTALGGMWVLGLAGFIFLAVFLSTGSQNAENLYENIQEVVAEEVEENTKAESSKPKSTDIVSGIADTYEKYNFQAPTEQIMQDFMDKGYDKIQLLTHTIEKSDSENAPIGTMDLITLQASYADSNDYFQISEKIECLYIYWGKELGWLNNYTQVAYQDGQYDFTGFNDTYWKFPEEESLYVYAYSFFPDMREYDLIGKVSAVYLHFGTLSVRSSYKDDRMFFADMQGGSMIMVCDGKEYVTEIGLSEEGTCDYSILIDKSESGWTIMFQLLGMETQENRSIRYTFDYENATKYNVFSEEYFIPIAKEEFDNVSNAMMTQ